MAHGVTTQTEFALTQKLDSKGLRPCIMHYHKDGCPKAKNGETCYWSHEPIYTSAEKNAMSVIAGKRLAEEEKLKAEKGKSGKSGGGKRGKSRSDSRGRKGGGKDSAPRKSDQPCRAWEQHGTCSYGDACRYAHVTKYGVRAAVGFSSR